MERERLRLPGKRAQLNMIASVILLFAHLVSQAQAAPTFMLVDADQTPAQPHQGTPGDAPGPDPPQPQPPQPPQPDDAKSKGVAPSASPPSPPPPQPSQPSQPPATNNTESNKTKPSKKSHPGDPALVQPASQYHYYGGNTEERRRRNVRFYPAPMKRKFSGYSRLKRNVRLSPKEMLALLALWDRPLALDDTAPVLPTQSSNRRYLKHQDIDRDLMMDDDDEEVDDDDDENEYGIQRSRDPWSEGRESGRRYFPQEPYRTEKRNHERNWQRQRERAERALEEEQQQQQLDAKKRFQRLVQKQLDELRREREREQARGSARYDAANMAAAEWGPYLDYKPEYKRRLSLGSARYKPEDAKLYRWLQLQGQ